MQADSMSTLLRKSVYNNSFPTIKVSQLSQPTLSTTTTPSPTNTLFSFLNQVPTCSRFVLSSSLSPSSAHVLPLLCIMMFLNKIVTQLPLLSFPSCANKDHARAFSSLRKVQKHNAVRTVSKGVSSCMQTLVMVNLVFHAALHLRLQVLAKHLGANWQHQNQARNIWPYIRNRTSMLSQEPRASRVFYACGIMITTIVIGVIVLYIS